jgi:tetratricopeptide (TPR) repeat protein
MSLHTHRIMLVFAVLLLEAAAAHAQRIPVGSSPATSSVVVRVQEPDGGPFDESADVLLSGGGDETGSHQFTRDAGQAEFDNLSPGTYYVLVTASGYKPGRDAVDVSGAGGVSQVWIRLEPDSGAARSVNGSREPVLAPKAQKAAAKGVEDLRTGKPHEAQKEFEAAYKLAPGDPDVNYLLGYALLQENDLEGSQIYLHRATSIEPNHISALVALGQLQLQQGNPPAAAATLQHAVSLDAGNWMAHWCLASAYMRDQQYDKARLEADAAVKSGKGAANGAEIIVGEAWAASGQTDKAIDALESFLRDAPGNSAAPAARAMIVKLTDERNADEVRLTAAADVSRSNSFSSGSASSSSTSSVAGLLPRLNIAESNLALPDWAPPSVDMTTPAVSPTAACSLSLVVEKTGKKIQEFVTNVGNIDAAEDLVHEKLNQIGKPTEKEKRRYDYMVNVVEVRPGHLVTEERRNGSTGADAFPDGIASTGLPSIALVFHPYMRDDYQMTCEGLGDWHGRPTWIVYFRQRDNLPGRISGYVVNGATHPISLKGRAWITADSFQIAHLETDMVKPMPEIQLTLEHISVDYKPVHFQARREEVWLPSSANLYFEYRKQRYHRLDSYSHYKLFSVDSTQEIQQPNEDDPGSWPARK